MKSSKGSEFERYISKQLSKWWTDGQRDDVFWRSQSSGARATIRKKVGKSTVNQEGDITATDSIGEPLIKFTTIELKRGYSDFTLEGFINRPNLKKPILNDFISQCKREIEGQKRFYWLIVKQDRKADIIIFGMDFRLWLAQRSFRPWQGKNSMILNTENFNVFVMRLDDFLNGLNRKFREALLRYVYATDNN